MRRRLARVLRRTANRLDPQEIRFSIDPIAARKIQTELLKLRREGGGRGLGLG